MFVLSVFLYLYWRGGDALTSNNTHMPNSFMSEVNITHPIKLDVSKRFGLKYADAV